MGINRTMQFVQKSIQNKKIDLTEEDICLEKLKDMGNKNEISECLVFGKFWFQNARLQ